MSQAAGGNEMESVKNYFNTAGFERWNKIYGTTSEVNKVQLDIRTGHAQTVDKVLAWLQDEGGVKGVSVCDVRLSCPAVSCACLLHALTYSPLPTGWLRHRQPGHPPGPGRRGGARQRHLQRHGGRGAEEV